MPWLSILDSSFSIFVVSQRGYEATPLQAVRVHLSVGRTFLHQRGTQMSFFLTQGLLTCFTCPPCFCMALPTMTQFGDWLHSSWGSLSASINGHWHHSLCLTYVFFWGLQPLHVTCGLHTSSVDAPVDIHGRSCNFPFFHPREALLVGHQVTALPLSSCGILFLSPLTEVVLHGVGLVDLSHVWWLPIHKRMPISDATIRSQFWWRTHDLPCWFVTLEEGRQLQFDAPPPKSLLPTYPWSSSFPSRHPPSLVPGHQASSSLCLFFCHSTISVSMLLPLIGLAPPIGRSSIYPIWKLCTPPLAWQRPLLGALLLPMVGKTKTTGSLGHHPNTLNSVDCTK